MKDVYILAGTRSPFARMGTHFSSLSAVDLGREVILSLLQKRSIDLGKVDEVIFGCVWQPVDSGNVAREIAMKAGLPERIPAMTVQRNCASGFDAVTTAYERIQSGRGELFLVGGAESMSHDLAATIGIEVGLRDAICGMNMGETAELLARDYDLSREDVDRFAAESQKRALDQIETRAKEISPLKIDGETVEADNGVRKKSSFKRLSKLTPVFDPEHGVVTAGNSSQITDGAVALLVGTKEIAEEMGLSPLGKIIDYAYTGCDPKRMGIGPVKAIHKANQRAALTLDDADLVEINEAFAAQVLACLKALSEDDYAKQAGLEKAIGTVDPAKLNRLGGAIALGHPVGATGARLVLSALHQLKEIDGKRALVSGCVGGGQGAALWLETV